MLSLLQLSQFRCFEQLRLELGPGMSVFLGDNAQGKTSILEAVCVLLRLQSPRTSALNEMIRFEEKGFGIAGAWNGQRLRMVKETGSRRKLYHFDNEVARGRAYLDHSGLVVWMGNQDVTLITGGGGGRRRYLDFQAAQLFLEYRVALRTYERALRARNQLLKQGGSPPWAQIDAYSGVLIPQGQRLMDFRSRLVEALLGEVDAAHRKISECRETLSLRYLPAVEPDEDFAQVLEASRERDWQRGQTMVGPHRDELAIEIDGRPAARFASEGQQRTIALALKLGQLGLLRREREQLPLLLVDDIFGELDPRRRAALAQAFPEDSQQLMTTTSLQWLPSTEGIQAGSLALFDVTAGQVRAR